MPKLCAFGCVPRGVPMHCFPNAAKYPERLKAWVNLVGGKLETESDYAYYRTKVVCDIHFTARDRNRNNRLNALAIPSLHLLGTSAMKSDLSFVNQPTDLPTTNTETSASEPVFSLVNLPSESHATNTEMPEIQLEEVRRFMEDCLKAVGAPESEAQAHADLLMHADTVGHYSHGLNRLVFYINDIKNGACEPEKKPEVLKDLGATAWVDGHNALGATVGNFCMKLAIQKAKEFGVGWVVAKRCNHFGMAGYWALLAEREGLVGMAFTNTSPIMVPTRSTQSALGTNPIGMAAPANDGDKLVVDMATTSVAMGKIECQIHKEEPLPPGWALGPDGKPTTDAKAAFKAGKLMPLGGDEKTSGYKGYALAAMVEMFTSGLSGSNMTHNIRGWETDSVQGPPNLGQCFAVINPDFFAPGFKDRASDCLNTWRNLEPADPTLPVLAPGDKEHKTGEVTLAKGTVHYPPKQVEAMDILAKRIGVQPLRTGLVCKSESPKEHTGVGFSQ